MTAIPCITLHQPWASLVAVGAKVYETRSWRMSYRGDIAIHAGRNWTEGAELIDELYDVWDVDDPDGLSCEHPAVLDKLEAAGLEIPDKLPYGAVVCVARLVDCRRTEDVAGRATAVFGDFSPGRWAWELADVRPLSPPVAVRGYPGIFAFDLTTGESSYAEKGAWS